MQNHELTSESLHRVYKSMWDGSYYTYIVKGTKKDLYAYIGYQYSNSLERINRISYEVITEKRKSLLEGFKEYYTVNEYGELIKHELIGE